MRDTTGAILDSVGYGDTTNAFVEAHRDHGAAHDRGSGQQLRPDPRRPRHERQRGRLLGQRDALAGRREPLERPGGRGAARAARQSLQRGMLGPTEASPILRLRGTPLAWRIQKTAETAAIGLIDQHTLERLLSPELMLVDAELAERARALLREPHEANGKGSHMSALGTHEFTAGTSLGLEPPLSPPVVRGPVASAMPVGDGGLSELPTPPPAIRPPEAAPAAAGSGARAGPGRGAPAARAGGSARSGSGARPPASGPPSRSRPSRRPGDGARGSGRAGCARDRLLRHRCHSGRGARAGRGAARARAGRSGRARARSGGRAPHDPA